MPPAPLSRRQQCEQLVSRMVGVQDYLSVLESPGEPEPLSGEVGGRGRWRVWGVDTLIPSKSTDFGIKVTPDSAASELCLSWSAGVAQLKTFKERMLLFVPAGLFV